MLKHKGDRNFYEFTLVKGQHKPVGTVSLELKKTDAKKSKFNLVVYADDKEYEKKDKNLNEPLQFYGGKGPGAVRDRSELDQRQEPDRGVSVHAQERAGAAYCSITGALGVSVRLGRYWKAKVKLRSLRASHWSFGQAEGGNECALNGLPGVDGVLGERPWQCGRQVRIGQEDAVVVRRVAA